MVQIPKKKKKKELYDKHTLQSIYMNKELID